MEIALVGLASQVREQIILQVCHSHRYRVGHVHGTSFGARTPVSIRSAPKSPVAAFRVPARRMSVPLEQSGKRGSGLTEEEYDTNGQASLLFYAGRR